MAMDSAKKMTWRKEHVLKLIELWRDKEMLFNPRHRFYHNKQARYQALEEITESLKEIAPEINQAEVKNKINYLRGQYSKELAKEKETRSGSSLEEGFQCTSTIYWYDELHFLRDFVQIRKSKSYFPVDLDESLMNSCSSGASPVKWRRNNDEISNAPEDNLILQVSSFLKSVQEKKDSRSDGICKFLEVELKTIKDEAIYDEVIENITLAVFNGKRKQKQKIKKQHSNEFILSD